MKEEKGWFQPKGTPNPRVQTKEQKRDKQARSGQGAERKPREPAQNQRRGKGVGKREHRKKEIGGKESINEEEMVMESGT